MIEKEAEGLQHLNRDCNSPLDLCNSGSGEETTMDHLKIALILLLALGALVVALRFAGARMKKSCDWIIQDLNEKKAFDPASAVPLSYSEEKVFSSGFRDFRPQALTQLVHLGRVRLLDNGKYYLSMPEEHEG